jgi:energy-coupling factor transporter ATP-binding protein EcfA2
MQQTTKFTVFVGNPGAGKSTLLNGLAGEGIFESGRSYGTGKTKYLKLYTAAPGVVYGDTPGLADTITRKEAALEIAKGLKQNGLYRIIFIVRLNDGRCTGDDAATIKVVLDAVPSDVPFAIILNQCSPEEKADLEGTDPGPRRGVAVSIFSECPDRTTDKFHIVLSEPTLRSKNNVIPPKHIVDQVKGFLDAVPFVHLGAEKVLAINAESITDLAEKIKADQLAHEKDKEAMQKKFEDLVKQAQEHSKAEIERNSASAKAQMEEMKQSFKKSDEEHAQRLKEASDNNNKELVIALKAQQDAQNAAHKEEMEVIRKQMEAVANRPIVVQGGGCTIC